MNTHQTRSGFVVGLLLYLFQDGHARQILFKRQYGTLDFMDAATYFLVDGYFPIQQAPIYGHECLSKDCSERRFHTVRFGSDAVVKFSNSWTISDKYIPDSIFIRFSITCPKGMLAMGITCYHGDCHRLQLHCGHVPLNFGQTTSNSKIIPPSNSTNISTCPNSMYVSGLECTNLLCIPTGLHCTTLKMNRRSKFKYTLDIAGNREVKSKLFGKKYSDLSEEMKNPIFKLTCFGIVCESITLSSTERGSVQLLRPVEKWTNHVEKEGTIASCPSGTVVARVKCEGRICGRIKLGCARPVDRNNLILDDNDIKFSDIFGMWDMLDGIFPGGYYFKQLSCIVDNCEKMVMGCVKASFIQ